jgi:DNA modification methylase
MLNLQVRGDEITKYEGADWTLYHGDCVRVVSQLPDEGVGLSVFSPPFSNLYIYSDYLEDMGNCASHEEFFAHFSFLIEQLLRVTKPGRLAAVHCNDQTRQKGIEGVAGLYDFPGDIIRTFESKGWTFHSRVTIWKDPAIEMQRTKNIGLLHKQLKKDSCASRMGRPDYILAFRKNTIGEANYPDPVEHTSEEFPVDQWQQWASPVWMNVRQTHVLQYRDAKDDEDERHICPLQLDVIERCIALWSNRGDVVLSPFAGIGSEGYQALTMGRKFIGAELKDSYAEVARRNLESAIASRNQTQLF